MALCAYEAVSGQPEPLVSVRCCLVKSVTLPEIYNILSEYAHIASCSGAL